MYECTFKYIIGPRLLKREIISIKSHNRTHGMTQRGGGDRGAHQTASHRTATPTGVPGRAVAGLHEGLLLLGGPLCRLQGRRQLRHPGVELPLRVLGPGPGGLRGAKEPTPCLRI